MHYYFYLGANQNATKKELRSLIQEKRKQIQEKKDNKQELQYLQKVKNTLLDDKNREFYDTSYDNSDTVPLMTMIRPFTTFGENSIMTPFTTSGENSIMRTSSRQYTKTMGKPGELTLEDSIYVDGKPKKQRREHYVVKENGTLLPKLKDDGKRVVRKLKHNGKTFVPKQKKVLE